MRPVQFRDEASDAMRVGVVDGDEPQVVAGAIMRCGETVWRKPFPSGEDKMSHSIANLEHHHYKYSRFRRPGDVHVHFFGTATLGFSDDFSATPGEIFEISAEAFGRPLRNTFVRAASNSRPARPLYRGHIPPQRERSGRRVS